jgi:hypothetical protein
MKKFVLAALATARLWDQVAQFAFLKPPACPAN